MSDRGMVSNSAGHVCCLELGTLRRFFRRIVMAEKKELPLVPPHDHLTRHKDAMHKASVAVTAIDAVVKLKAGVRKSEPQIQDMDEGTCCPPRGFVRGETDTVDQDIPDRDDEEDEDGEEEDEKDAEEQEDKIDALEEARDKNPWVFENHRVLVEELQSAYKKQRVPLLALREVRCSPGVEDINESVSRLGSRCTQSFR